MLSAKVPWFTREGEWVGRGEGTTIITITCDSDSDTGRINLCGNGIGIPLVLTCPLCPVLKSKETFLLLCASTLSSVVQINN